MDRSRLIVALALVLATGATLIGLVNIAIGSAKTPYASASSSFFTGASRGVALIDISGIIEDGAYAPAGSDRIVQQLDDALYDPLIQGVVLSINSPGGTVGATKKIYNKVREVQAKKHVVAIVSDIAASGGYYVASGADRILAYPASLIGSIGVIMIRPDFSGFMDKYGIRMNALKAGRFKDMSYPFRDLTDEEKRLYQEMLDDSYEQFKADVREGRKQSIDTVDRWAEGRIYSGKKAEQLQMIDDFGGLDEALAWIAKEEKLSPDDLEIYRPQKDLMDELFGRGLLPGLLNHWFAGPVSLQHPSPVWYLFADSPGFNRVVQSMPVFAGMNP
ncbi:MAG: signal peptide peptidase SppA [Leptospiraceae bacterium]|nr:signal peptide peptidase SppA [Leptospiraceae bacterium]